MASAITIRCCASRRWNQGEAWRIASLRRDSGHNYAYAIGEVLRQVLAHELPCIQMDDGRSPACAATVDAQAAVPGCPLYAMFATREGHALHVERLRESVGLPRRGREAGLAELAAAFAARIEHHARRAPLDWFNFYDFWHLPDSERPHAAH